MIPLIASSTDFSGYRAPLRDTISCVVTEERNGLYELKMSVGMDDPNFAEIENNKYILAKANDTEENLQGFRIYSIEKNLNGRATIYAEHVSRRMKYIPLNPTDYTGSLSVIVQRIIREAIAVSNPFTITTDWEKTNLHFNVGVPTSYSLC